jgi:hypothetical protein
MRSLFLNLKDKGNPGLRNEIVLGHVTAHKVVRMSKDEMASESVRMMNEKLEEHNLFKAKAVGEVQVGFVFGKCSAELIYFFLGRNGRVQVRPLWTAQVYLLPDADSQCRRAYDCEC